MPKARNKSKKSPPPKRIEKAEAWAYSYIRNMGNGTAAAREVFGLEGNSASQCATDFLRNPQVQQIIGEYLDAQRETFKKFTEQGNYYFAIVAEQLMKILTNEKTSIPHRFEAMEKLLRLGGFEVSENVTVAKMQAKADAARGRAVLPGIAAPGIQPGAPAASFTDNRKAIFMLMPPPMPPGGVPPPALLEQWKDQGWVPGVQEPPAESK